MKRILYILFLLFIVLACGGPSGDLDTPGTDPTPEPTPSYSITANPANFTVPSDERTVQTTITSSGAWTLNGTESWCKPSKTSGKGDENLSFTIETNASLDARNVRFTLTCGTAEATISITQEGIEGVTGSNEGIGSGEDITF